MAYDCDYDPPEFWQRSVHKAVKLHECSECGAPILPGEEYEYVRGKWDGVFDVLKTCEACHDIRQWTKNNVPCLCWAHGSMMDDCREAVEEAAWRAPLETAGLRFGFLRRLVKHKRLNAAKRADPANPIRRDR